MTDIKLPPPMYGVWLPGQGWLRGEGDYYAEANLAIARSTAKRIGQHARVEYFDKSLGDLQVKLLQHEVLPLSLKLEQSLHGLHKLAVEGLKQLKSKIGSTRSTGSSRSGIKKV